MIASLVIISLTIVLNVSLWVFKCYVKKKFGANLIEIYENEKRLSAVVHAENQENSILPSQIRDQTEVNEIIQEQIEFQNHDLNFN